MGHFNWDIPTSDLISNVAYVHIQMWHTFNIQMNTNYTFFVRSLAGTRRVEGLYSMNTQTQGKADNPNMMTRETSARETEVKTSLINTEKMYFLSCVTAHLIRIHLTQSMLVISFLSIYILIFFLSTWSFLI